MATQRKRKPNKNNRAKADKYKTRYRNYKAVKRRAEVKKEVTLHQKGILRPPFLCDECNSPNVEYTTYGLWRDTAQRAVGQPWAHNRMYGCTDCGARVGVHKGSNYPLGFMADRLTRQLRKNGKIVFIKAIKTVFGGSKDRGYAWLAQVMELPPSKAHWAQFNAAQCRQARDHAIDLLFQHDE